MNNESNAGDASGSSKVNALLREYQHLVDQGQRVDREKLIRSNPDHEATLRAYFADDEMIDQLIHESTLQWQAAETISEMPPQVAGFEILDVLRAGGMGIVYRARQLSLNRVVALKTLLVPKVPRQLLNRFEVESAAIARLQHPHVVQIIEVGNFEGRPFFAMELMEGGNLEERLAEKGMSLDEAAKLIQELAGAIDYSHSKGVLHRDLKPSNVLFTSDGIPKLADFGLAKLVNPDHSQFGDITHSDAILGTPEYMAPEQAKGQSDKIGQATDIYGLGAVLYRIIAGRPPFRGRNGLETMRLVQSGKLCRPSHYNPDSDIGSGIEAICLKCLMRETTDRYRSGKELALDLESWRAGGTPQARRDEEFKRRRRLLMLAGPTAALALAGAYGTRSFFSEGGSEDVGTATPDMAAMAVGPVEEIVFPAEADSYWRALDSPGSLEVNSSEVALLGLGNSESGAFTFQMDILPNTAKWNPKGGIGIFYSYRASEGATAEYRTIELSDGESPRKFVLRHNAWVFAIHHGGSMVDSSDVQAPEGRLLLKGRAGAPPKVSWDGVDVLAALAKGLAVGVALNRCLETPKLFLSNPINSCRFTRASVFGLGAGSSSSSLSSERDRSYECSARD